MSDSPKTIVRPVQSGDLADVVNLDRLAFAPLVNNQVIEQEWYNGTLNLPGRDLFLAVEEGTGTAVGGYAQLDLGISFRHQEIPTMGIAAVAVAPHRRGQQIARLMLEHALQIGQQKKIPLIALYPFQHGFYRKLGWAWVGRSYQYRVATRDLPVYPERVNVIPYQATQHEASLKQVYATAATRQNGWLQRREWQWQSKLKPENGKEIYVYQEAGTLSGYVIFQYVELPPTSDLIVVVNEWVALTPTAYRGIIGFLASLRDQIGTVFWNTHAEDPFPHLLKEQRSNPTLADTPFRFGLVHRFGAIGGGFMWRLVDLEQAFERRPIQPTAPFALTFQVTDPILGEKTISLEFGSDQLSLLDKPVADVVTLSIEHLTVLFAGMRPAADLMWTGEITFTGNPELLNYLDAAWKSPSPFCWDFF